MVSKGKPSPRRAVKPLSDVQVRKLAAEYALVDPTRPFPIGRMEPNQREIDELNPKITHRLVEGAAKVLRASCKVRAWGLENVPVEGAYITCATHVAIRRVRADGRDVPDGPPPTVHGQGGDGQVAGHRQMVPRGRHATGAATQRQGARDRRGVGTDSHEQSCADNLARGNGDARPEKVADEHEERRRIHRARGVAPRRSPDSAVLRGDVGCGEHQSLVAVAAQERRHVLRHAAGLLRSAGEHGLPARSRRWSSRTNSCGACACA